MTEINPTKYIRKAIVDSMSPIKVYYKRVPKDIAVGTSYVTISDQATYPRDVSRCGYEWRCTVTINANVISEQGMPPTTSIDDLAQSIHNAMKDLDLDDGFVVKSIRIVSQVDLEEFREDADVDRRVMTYELWLNRYEAT